MDRRVNQHIATAVSWMLVFISCVFFVVQYGHALFTYLTAGTGGWLIYLHMGLLMFWGTYLVIVVERIPWGELWMLRMMILRRTMLISTSPDAVEIIRDLGGWTHARLLSDENIVTGGMYALKPDKVNAALIQLKDEPYWILSPRIVWKYTRPTFPAPFQTHQSGRTVYAADGGYTTCSSTCPPFWAPQVYFSGA